LDIIRTAIDIEIKHAEITSMLQLFRNELQKVKKPEGDGKACKYEFKLDYQELFRIFAEYRKIKLIRFLFGESMEFSFTTDVFKIALECDAYDVCVLLHNEFRYKMRDNSYKDNQDIVNKCVASIYKSSGMIE